LTFVLGSSPTKPLAATPLAGRDKAWVKICKEIQTAVKKPGKLRGTRARDLSKHNLDEADPRGANLRQALLSGEDLRGANLSQTDLSGAYLRSANLYGADLSKADLSQANLSQANLGEANLSATKFATLNGPTAARTMSPPPPTYLAPREAAPQQRRRAGRQPGSPRLPRLARTRHV